MKKSTITLLLIFAVVSCKTKEKETRTTEETTEDIIVEVPVHSLEVGCYTYDANGSKVVMEITQINDSVMGQLDYALKEKDANSGTFSGILNDSVLIGNYTFKSEGVESSREIAFVFKDDQLVEGYGELDETGTAFKDKETINFTSSMPLTKSECD
ncbi:hypothetical protein PY092_02540 [Muricauda sp. 334s03]|uniref:Copper homeostasis protein n=1 Tax=Flagellimonas yonaguniensis TaxID=3031325 RepID=A0ABT5XV03_9FLAO|nr:hypothetical protein [[Muricauda] yonaguniensis]MDF0715014.1 hypothetical protein [[Muricauda] yonaguniensis]